MSGGDGKDSRGPTGGIKGGASDQGPNVGHGGSMDTNIPGMGDVHIDGVHGLNPGQDNSTNWEGGTVRMAGTVAAVETPKERQYGDR